jgi:hypothetical protein
MHHVQIVATMHITCGKAEHVGPGNENGPQFAKKTLAHSQAQCQHAGADSAHPTLLVASIKNSHVC